jgi:hypothetical protein
MEAKRLDHVRLVQYHQVRRRAFSKPKLTEIDSCGCVHGNHVVEFLRLQSRHHPQQVRSEKGDFQHVVAAERIIGITNIVLAEANRDALREQFLDADMQRTGMRIGHHRDARLL